jgi:AcrR family transcriptional regulator
MSGTARREALAESATDYTLSNGLIGLSLRPLAAALGTSDRMLLYHFEGKDDLVATVLRLAVDRSVAAVRSLPASSDVRSAVHELWRAVTEGQLEACQRLYVQAAALGLLGQEPYASVAREANERWLVALADHLRDAGCPDGSTRRAVTLLDATFIGLQLDQPLDRGSADEAGTIAVLADAVAALTAT